MEAPPLAKARQSGLPGKTSSRGEMTQCPSSRSLPPFCPDCLPDETQYRYCISRSDLYTGRPSNSQEHRRNKPPVSAQPLGTPATWMPMTLRITMRQNAAVRLAVPWLERQTCQGLLIAL